MRTTAALARFSVLFLGIVATRQSAPAENVPDLSGAWRLNRAQSDDPREKWREAAGDGSDDAGGAPPSSGGRRGWRGRGGGGRGSGDGQGAGLPVLEDRDRLTIVHAEPRLAITDAAGNERVVFTDGREQTEERSRGGTTKVEALWKDGHVVVTSKPEHGPKTVEAYAVSADRSQLTVTTTVSGRRSVTFRRVYDAVRPAPAAPAPDPEDGGADDGVDVTCAAAGAP